MNRFDPGLIPSNSSLTLSDILTPAELDQYNEIISRYGDHPINALCIDAMDHSRLKELNWTSRITTVVFILTMPFFFLTLYHIGFILGVIPAFIFLIWTQKRLNRNRPTPLTDQNRRDIHIMAQLTSKVMYEVDYRNNRDNSELKED